jgi:hypothetical protein
MHQIHVAERIREEPSIHTNSADVMAGPRPVQHLLLHLAVGCKVAQLLFMIAVIFKSCAQLETMQHRMRAAVEFVAACTAYDAHRRMLRPECACCD